MADLLQHVRESGFPYPDRLILLFVGGSELHGAKVHGTDDLDIYGIYIEPPEMVLGLESMPHFVWSTAGNDRRNGPSDVDVTLYSLKKWAGLACKGNPTALHFLFAENAVANNVWIDILRDRRAFLARTFVKPFLGFADDQLKRMTGSKGRGKKGQRPEIEEKFGYDVKAAMHTLRLLYECKNCCRMAGLRCLVLNGSFWSACVRVSIRWTRWSRWRRSFLRNARKRPNRPLCRSEWTGSVSRES